MHRYQNLLQPSLQARTRVQKVDVSALTTRRNRSFYLFGGMGINSHTGDAEVTIKLCSRVNAPGPGGQDLDDDHRIGGRLAGANGCQKQPANKLAETAGQIKIVAGKSAKLVDKISSGGRRDSKKRQSS